MKIIFDNNVLVAAFLRGGACREVLDNAIHEHELYLTPYIINEFKDVFKRFHFQESLINEFLAFLNKYFIIGETAKAIEKISRDPDDDPVLADALANGLEVILTGDKDLLDLKSYKGIRILSPKDYWTL